MQIFFQVAAVVSPITAVVFAFLAFRRNQKTDDNAAAREIATIKANVESLNTNIGKVLEKLDKINEQMSDTMARLAVVESDVNRAHERLGVLASMVGAAGKI